MITGFFLQVAYLFLVFMIGLLPIVAIPTAWLNALTLIWGYVNALNFLFPVSTLLTVVVFALSFHVAILLLRMLLWVIHLIRGR